MQLLIYTNPLEPLTRVLLKHKEELNITPLYVQDLLEHGTIFDKIDDEQVSICWDIPEIGQVTNSKQTYLINRVFNCPYKWLESFEEEDQKYAHAEWWAYLLFALDAFPNKTESPGVGSLTGSCYSLPKQWAFVESLDCKKSIKTPQFYIGHDQGIPESWNRETIICSNVFNFYQWKPNLNQYQDNYTFIMQRPPGEPYLCFNTQQQTSLHPMHNLAPIQLEQKLQDEVCELSRHIHHSMEFYVSETLFFINEQEITFGMSHNYPLAASQTPDFEEKICQLFQ